VPLGFIGVLHGVSMPIERMFRQTAGVRGGSAPVRVYLPDLLHDVLAGKICRDGRASRDQVSRSSREHLMNALM
jgi:hypothetical protein